MLKSIGKPEKSGLTAVEKNVEKISAFNRQIDKPIFNKELMNFPHKNVENSVSRENLDCR